jgi:hypothetical protein
VTGTLVQELLDRKLRMTGTLGQELLDRKLRVTGTLGGTSRHELKKKDIDLWTST